MRHRITLLLLCAAVAPFACHAQSYLYVTNGGSNNNQVSGYAVTPATGALTAVPGSPFAAAPDSAFIAVDRAGRFAYAVSPNSFDISAYTINPATGTLTAVSGSPFATGSQPDSAAVDPTGHFVYVANSLSNNVSAYKIDPSTGALAAVFGSPFAAGTSPHFVTVDPTGQFVYVANLTSSNISAYTINPFNGALTPVTNSPFIAGLSPHALTVDPTGQFVFVADGSNNISAYVINLATGALAAIAGSPFATESEPNSVTVDPTGRFLYVTNAGSNSVSAYTIDATDGALTSIPGSPFRVGIGPFSAALDPTGHRAYVTSTVSANIFAYTIDSDSGALAVQSGSPFATEGISESIAAASVSGPVLGIASSHASNFIQGQSGFTYSVAVGNTGAGATNGVVTMAERVPAGLTLVSMAGSGWTCASGSVICTRIDSLAAGASYPTIAVTMNVAANAPAAVTNVVSVSGFGTATAIASDTASVVQLPTLTILSSHAGTFYQGERGATYSIAVSNTGPGATSGPVTVNDALPSGLTLVSLAGDGWTCPGNGSSCNRNDALASGASYPAIAVTVNVAADAPETVTNQVSVSGGGAAAASASDPTVIPQPVLTITSSHTGNFTQGQNSATYSVTVSNGPVTAPDAPLLNASTIAVAIGASSCNDYQSVTLTSSGASIPFTVAVNYPNGTSNGDNNGAWLYASVAGSGSTSNGTTVSSTSGTTGVTLTIGLNRSIGAVTDTGQVIITPTNSPASAPVTITVFYQQIINCGIGGFVSNGFVTITPGNIALTAATNGQQSTSVSIQNITGSGLTFGYSVSPTGSWLSASATTTIILGNLSTQLNVTANAALTAGVGNYTGFVTVTPQTGFGTAVNIPVTFTVTNTGTGTDSGTLTVNGATSNTISTAFSYAAPFPPGDQCVPLQDSAPGANSYTSTVSTNNGGNWLLANNQLNTDTVQILAPGTPNACVELTLNPTVAYNLQSGAYQGSVALTSSSGSTATINVNYYVSAGAAPGVTPIPGPIYVFPSVAPNTSIVQQQGFTISALSGIVLAPPVLAGADGFSISAPIASGNVETFTVTSNSTGLGAGIYSTTITVQSSGSFSGATTITLVLPVVQPAASAFAIGPSSLALQQQSGSTFWTSGKEAQAITISGAQGTQWSAFVVYGSGANWLTFDSPAGGSGTLGNSPATLIVDLFNGVSSLSPSSTPYVATVNITTSSGTYYVAVSLLVTSATGPVLLGVPASATFWATTSSSSTSQTVTVVGSDNTNSTTIPQIVAGAPTATWVAATASGNTLTIGVNAAGLTAGVYSATIPISASAYSSVNYPVVMIVSSAGGSAGKGITSTIGQVTVTESVPSGLQLVSMAGSGWNCPTGGNTCTRSDSIDAGASYSAITVTVNVANTAPPSVVNQVSASGAGSASANASDDTTVISSCALTQDGTAGVADVQRVINEVLGAAQAVDDLNLDGAVNVVDIQIVMNASLGFGCTL